MGKVISSFVFISLVLSGGACSLESEPLIPSTYSSWDQTTEVVLNYPITGHGENLRKIFINTGGNPVSMEERRGVMSFTYPEETIVVKEVYSSPEPGPDGQPVMLTAMVKRPNDERSRGGWLWVVVDTSTGTEQIIEDQFCFTCHSNANENHPFADGNPLEEFRDFIFFPYDGK